MAEAAAKGSIIEIGSPVLTEGAHLGVADALADLVVPVRSGVTLFGFANTPAV